MAQTKRNEAQWTSPVELEPASKGCGDIAESDETSMGPLSDEALNLGHACLRSECWSGMGEVAFDRACGATAIPPSVTRRRGTPRKGSSRHHPRPLRGAEARFTSDDYEFLTD